MPAFRTDCAASADLEAYASGTGSSHRWNTAIFSAGHAPSQGMVPLFRR